MLRIVKGVAPAAIIVSALAACSSSHEPVMLTDYGVTGSSAAPSPRPAPEQAQAPQARTQAKTNVADGRQHTSFYLPTGHEDSSVLLVERDLPAQIVAGQEFAYDIKVTNVNHSAAKAVTVRDDCA